MPWRSRIRRSPSSNGVTSPVDVTTNDSMPDKSRASVQCLSSPSHMAVSIHSSV